jgi:hypothetical protein
VKVLVIGGGASWSIKDVENGVVDGLRQAGVEVGRYALDRRIQVSGDYLDWLCERAKANDAKTADPTALDVQVHALRDALGNALGNGVDWVIFVSCMFVPLPIVQLFRASGLPVAMVMTESPYDLEQELIWGRQADLVWTSERSVVQTFAAVGPAAHYLPHAWREDVHQPASAGDVPAHDVVFVGSCFDEREELLSAIDWTGIDFGLYGNWQRLDADHPLRAHLREETIDNDRAAALYRRAKIGLNLYRVSKGWATGAPRIAHAESLNPRAYELAACGCFHLSQYRAEVDEVFGDLVPTFSTPAGCEAMIRRWLADDAWREAVAVQLPAAVEAHTWRARGAQMARALREELPAALGRVGERVEERKARAVLACEGVAA